MIFKPNPAVIAQLEGEPAYEALMETRAEEAKSHAEAMAPRGSTGDYADSFTLFKSGSRWKLGNLDWAAHWVEWGSIHQAPLAILRRAVQAAGLHLKEAPKP
jgi:hypothetical protein